MEYTKPDVRELGPAGDVIQFNGVDKTSGPTECDPNICPAYDLDE